MERDQFTENLLLIFTDLIEKGALYKKTPFVKAAMLELATFNKIEKRERNYPNDQNRKREAVVNLYEKYGVNPEFMKGHSQKRFLREPEKIEKASVQAVKYNFRDKAEKTALLKELEQFKELYRIEHDKVLKLEEELSQYKVKKKSDKNPDSKA